MGKTKLAWDQQVVYRDQIDELYQLLDLNSVHRSFDARDSIRVIDRQASRDWFMFHRPYEYLIHCGDVLGFKGWRYWIATDERIRGGKEVRK